MNNLFEPLKGLRVLLYHKVSHNNPDFMTVTPPQLESHITYIQKKNFAITPLEEVISADFKPKPHHKIVVFTFDDGYLNYFDTAYPILKNHKIPNTVFLPTAYIGDKSRWDNEKAEPIMCVNALKKLDNSLTTFGLHSHNHFNFETSSVNSIKTDLIHNIAFFKNNDLNYLPVLAYPYGKRPKDPSVKITLYREMSELGIHHAFRIGNRVNPLPLKKTYEIERIDVKGSDSFQKFKWNLHFGKLI